MKKIIEDFITLGGSHCITNALKQIFTYYGNPMSEEMMFGLASGLSFLYINQAYSPMINGRTKVFVFEETLASRLHITINCKKGSDMQKISDKTKQLINTNNPVLVYVDMPYLRYLGLPSDGHFGGHAVVLFGYDDTTQKYWVSDRDHSTYPIRVPNGELHEDYHLVDYEELEKARNSSFRPFPANNKYLEFDFTGYQSITKEVLCEAIQETCEAMLQPPAKLLGLNGIMKFSKEILKWKYFTKEKLCIAATTNYFQISKDGGTGGGLFRRMYGDFLIEASMIMNDEVIKAIGKEFKMVSTLWDALADAMWMLSNDADCAHLSEMSSAIIKIHDIENGLFEQLKKTAQMHE